MRGIGFNKDGYGALVGHLTDRCEIDADAGGVIEHFHLSGKVVDTEFDNVVVMGKKINDHEVSVSIMESMPKEGDPYYFWKWRSRSIYLVVIPEKRLQSIEEHYKKNGSPYKEISFDIKTKTETERGLHCSLKVRCSNFQEHPRLGAYVFITDKTDEQEAEFGKGFKKIKRRDTYMWGQQLLS